MRGMSPTATGCGAGSKGRGAPSSPPAPNAPKPCTSIPRAAEGARHVLGGLEHPQSWLCGLF